MTIDVRALPCIDGSVVDLADPQVTQFTQWQVPSNDKHHTHPLILSNDPFFNLRGITRELFDNTKSDEKFLAVDFFIPTSGFGEWSPSGNLYISHGFREQQIEFLMSWFENYEEIKKKLVLGFCDESPELESVLETLYSLMAIYNVPTDKVIIMGQNFAGQEVINKFAKTNGETPFQYIVAWWMLGHLDCAYIESIVERKYLTTGKENDGIIEVDYFYNPVQIEPKRNTFIFLNRRETSNRIALLWWLWKLGVKHYKFIHSAFPPLRLFGLSENRDDASPSEDPSKRNHYTRVFFKSILEQVSPKLADEITDKDVHNFKVQMDVGKTIKGDHKFIGDQESKFVPLNNDAYIWLTCESTSELKETNFFFTEKVLKPMAYGQALVVHAQPGFLKAFKQLGFYTLADELGIDESYDDIQDDGERLEFIANEIIKISKVPTLELHERYVLLEDKINHNRKLMWCMLSNISQNFIDAQSRYITDSILNFEYIDTNEALKSYKEFFNIKTLLNK